MWQNLIEKNLNRLKECGIEPYDFQVSGIAEAISILEKKGFTMLEYEMGLGKTLSSLLITALLRKKGLIDSVIIVCPKNIINTWISEMEKVYSSHVFRSWPEYKHKSDATFFYKAKTPIFIINTEAFSNKNEKLNKILKQFFRICNPFIILDESSWIKNQSSQRSKRIIQYFDFAKYKLALTGTIIGKSPLDVYTQFKYLKSDFWGMNWWKFRNTYALIEDKYVRAGRTAKVIVGYQKQEELHSKIKPYIVSRYKKNCLDLPEKVYQDVILDMNTEQQKIYKKLKDDMWFEYKGKLLTVTQKHVLFGRFRQITDGYFPESGDLIGKNNVKKQFILEDTENYEGKITVWNCFVAGIESWASEKNCVLYYGKIADMVRKTNLFSFEKLCNIKYCVLNPLSASYGLNLQFSSLVYYCNRPLSAEQNTQSEDRNHRIGSKESVIYKNLIMKDTVDERIKEITIKDKQTLKDFQEGIKKDPMKELTVQDLFDIL